MEVQEITSALEGAYSDWQKETHAWQAITALGIKPYKDGNQWCFLYGEDLQSGICGFGETVLEAALNFYKEIVG